MAWDMSKLIVGDVLSPEEGITDADYDVTISIVGGGFTSVMFGMFMLSNDILKSPRERVHVIPCNDVNVCYGSYGATMHICPRRKAVGVYDLMLWTSTVVSFADLTIPMSDVYVFPNAITIQAAALPSLEVEKARGLAALKRMAKSRRAGADPLQEALAEAAGSEPKPGKAT